MAAKRPRTDFEMPGGMEMPGYYNREEERAALRVTRDTESLNASGACKNCKPCSGSSAPNRGRTYADSDVGTVSERFYGSYRRTASFDSTSRLRGKALEAKLKSLSSGSATPASVSGRTKSLFMEEDELKELVAQVEPSVLITLVSLPHGGNDLKRIPFRDVV